MKKILSLILVLTLSLGGVGAFADSNRADGDGAEITLYESYEEGADSSDIEYEKKENRIFHRESELERLISENKVRLNELEKEKEVLENSDSEESEEALEDIEEKIEEREDIIDDLEDELEDIHDEDEDEDDISITQGKGDEKANKRAIAKRRQKMRELIERKTEKIEKFNERYEVLSQSGDPVDVEISEMLKEKIEDEKEVVAKFEDKLEDIEENDGDELSNESDDYDDMIEEIEDLEDEDDFSEEKIDGFKEAQNERAIRLKALEEKRIEIEKKIKELKASGRQRKAKEFELAVENVEREEIEMHKVDDVEGELLKAEANYGKVFARKVVKEKLAAWKSSTKERYKKLVELKKEKIEEIKASEDFDENMLKVYEADMNEKLRNLKAERSETYKKMKETAKKVYTKEDLAAVEKIEKEISVEHEGLVPLPVESVVSEDADFKFDVPPVIKKGRTLVPIRAITEAFGADVGWDEETKTVSIIKGEKIIEFKVGETKMLVDGKEVAVEVPSEIIKGRTIVPLRFVSENFGKNVEWDAETKTIDIN